MRRVAILVALLLVAVSCGDDTAPERADPASTTASTASEPPSTAPLPTEPPFEIARAVEYIGQTLDGSPDGYGSEAFMRTERLSVSVGRDPRVVLFGPE